MGCITENPNNEVFFEMNDNLTIQSIHDLKLTFITAVEKKANIVLLFNERIEPDLTFLQLLCSMHQALKDEGNSISITGRYTDSLNEVAFNAGYKQHSKCAFDKNSKCFWSGENL